MEKKVYLVYESSKGRKDVVLISLDKYYACKCASCWNHDEDLHIAGFRYTVYEFPLDVIVSFNKYYPSAHPCVVSL